MNGGSENERVTPTSLRLRRFLYQSVRTVRQSLPSSDALTAKCASPFLKNVMCSPRTVWGLPKSYVSVMSTFVSATVAASGVIHSRTAHTPISR